MEHRGEELVTFSVRQLALMFGKSEQSVRRWKDEGKLKAGLPGEEESEAPGGPLVFTLEAVQDFVRRNPRVMNHAKREFITEHLGEDGEAILRQVAPRRAAAAVAGTAATVAGALFGSVGMLAGGAAALASGAAIVGKRNYVEQLLQSRKGELKRLLDQFEEERGQILREKDRHSGSEYLTALLTAREREVEQNIAKIREEMEQLAEEQNRLNRER